MFRTVQVRRSSSIRACSSTKSDGVQTRTARSAPRAGRAVHSRSYRAELAEKPTLSARVTIELAGMGHKRCLTSSRDPRSTPRDGATHSASSRAKTRQLELGVEVVVTRRMQHRGHGHGEVLHSPDALGAPLGVTGKSAVVVSVAFHDPLRQISDRTSSARFIPFVPVGGAMWAASPAWEGRSGVRRRIRATY